MSENENTAAGTIRIDVVSDVVCPYCILGYKQLEKASEQSGVAIDLHWHPFELNPQMPKEGENLREHLAKKYGTTLEQSIASRARLTEAGAQLGFSFQYTDDMRMYNTFQAHQLLHWADQQGKQTALKLALFDAFFTRREDVSDETVLVDVAETVGLDREEAERVLREKTYAGAVRADQRFWLERGIQGVPAYILNQRYLVSGAQGVENLSRVLTQVAAEKAA
ncbi:DsbA family oxidoreductase [Stappia sp. F7233]|uniref:DsbA family oxidoreductase n=1 Tax=Stappia albiluteola TaxID=2758565 RepID=A0A839AFD6_9HYPH|nr:DsbA family oxidoreductase [Stappia albiluteola]MBA5777602.1 DsbA family oxidoreductase [Stappia albiluteola]